MGHLSVVIPPDIADDDGSAASAPEGGSVALRCTATGVPGPTVSWKRNEGRNIVFRDEDGKENKGQCYLAMNLRFYKENKFIYVNINK